MREILLHCLFYLLFLPLLAQQELSSEQISAIDKLFERFHQQPGIALAIVKEGKPLFQQGYGLANLEEETSISSQTVFDVASLSKQFTAACIHLLALEGKLGLDDPVRQYIPELADFPEGEIKISHLIHHTSGLRDYLALLFSKGLDWDGTYDNSDILSILADQRHLLFPPGSRYAYSNSGYVLLAVIVERVSGSSMGTFAKKAIFEPLEMRSSFYDEDRHRIPKHRAIGYGTDNVRNHFETVTVTGDGGLHTSMEDFVKWSNNFQHGKVGGHTFIERMRQTAPLNNGKTHVYASGLITGEYRNLPGLESIGHDGAWSGFRSLFFHFLDQELTVILFSNSSTTDVWGLFSEILLIVMREELRAAEQQFAQQQSQTSIETYEMSKNEKQQFVGNFYQTTDGATREIVLRADTLIYVRSDGRETILKAVGKHELVFHNMPFVRLNFDEGRENLTIHINEQEPLYFQRYQPVNPEEIDMQRFAGTYQCEELDVEYSLRLEGKNLRLTIGNRTLVVLRPLSERMFSEIEFGYVQFEEDEAGNISGFVRHDNSVGYFVFKKVG